MFISIYNRFIEMTAPSRRNTSWTDHLTHLTVFSVPANVLVFNIEDDSRAGFTIAGVSAAQCVPGSAPSAQRRSAEWEAVLALAHGLSFLFLSHCFFLLLRSDTFFFLASSLSFLLTEALLPSFRVCITTYTVSLSIFLQQTPAPFPDKYMHPILTRLKYITNK